jgi:tRNA (cytidine/uridine-2'-O-)-methyltransferase
MRIVLYQPQIPPNTGNIARLCAATGTPLHLIEPLGFKIDDKHLLRAGLDYWKSVDIRVHPHWAAFEAACPGVRCVLTSARAGETHASFRFRPGDAIVLGPETRGLPQELFDICPERVRIPIFDTVRSLNLSTSAGILLYEALRQTDALPGQRLAQTAPNR